MHTFRLSTALFPRIAVIGCLALAGSATMMCADQALSPASAQASVPLPPPPPPPPPVEEPPRPGENTPPTKEPAPKTEETKTTTTPSSAGTPAPSSASTPVSGLPAPAPGVPVAAKVKAKSSRSCKRVKHHLRCKRHSKSRKHHAGSAHAASVVLFQPGTVDCTSEKVTFGQPRITVNDPNSGIVDWALSRLDVWTGSGWQTAGWGHWHYQYRQEPSTGFIDYNTGEVTGDVLGAAAGQYYRVVDWVYDAEIGHWYSAAESLNDFGMTSNTYYCYMEPSTLNW
jgi:hypothetical protein